MPQAVCAVLNVLLLFYLEVLKALHKLVDDVPLVVKIVHWKIFSSWPKSFKISFAYKKGLSTKN